MIGISKSHDHSIYFVRMLLFFICLRHLLSWSANAFWMPPRRTFSIFYFDPFSSSSLRQKMDPKTEKIQSQAVKRFTIGYDKLCKNCPTRLQPRVDTLTEMIMGLESQEREELLQAVARRISDLESSSSSSSQSQQQGLKTPEQVYLFQVGMNSEQKIVSTVRTTKKKKQGPSSSSQTAVGIVKDEKNGKASSRRNEKSKNIKVLKSMEDSKEKLSKSKLKLVQTNRLVEVVSLFLTEGTDITLPDSLMDISLEGEIRMLRDMGRPELKLQLLTYKEKKAKCEKAEAKSRKKCYAASLKLSTVYSKS